MRYRLLLQGARVNKSLRKRSAGTSEITDWDGFKWHHCHGVRELFFRFPPYPTPIHHMKNYFLFISLLFFVFRWKFHFSAPQHLCRGIKNESREDCDWRRSCAMFSFIIFIIIGPFGLVVFRHAKFLHFLPLFHDRRRKKIKSLGSGVVRLAWVSSPRNEFFCNLCAHGSLVPAPAFI